MQKPDLFKRCRQFVESDAGSLANLKQKVSHIQKLNTLIQPFLPPELQSECLVTDLQPPTLFIQANTAAAAMHLRMLTPEVLQQLHAQKSLFEIKEITCRVAKSGFIVPPKEKKIIKRSISSDSRNILKDLSLDIDNPSLKLAIEKLVKSKH